MVVQTGPLADVSLFDLAKALFRLARASSAPPRTGAVTARAPIQEQTVTFPGRALQRRVRWLRLFGQFFRFDMWILCRV
jgi:hypothetical protein